MAEYYVVLGDVVHSREIEDREAFQERLQAVCARFTAEKRDDVFGNFKILKGIDEFGGVLQSLENLYEVVTAFQDALRPDGVRIVVSSGLIDVGLTSFDVEQMDGEAFHEASERLEEIEDGPLAFDLLIADETLGRAVADEINLLLHRRGEWTDRQREVVGVREGKDTQTAAAEELGVSQQAVSNVLGGANWPLIHEVEGRLRETLGEYVEVWEDGMEAVEWNNDGTADEIEAALETAIEGGAIDTLLADLQPRLTEAIEPALVNATDGDHIVHVLDLLADLAERGTGPVSQDVKNWSSAQYARLVGTPHDRMMPSTELPGALVSDSYVAGLGYLLAEQPESAVQYLRNAWEHRNNYLPDQEREYAWSAGFALLGCVDVLGPSILDARPEDVLDELTANQNLLRQPARHILEAYERGGDADPPGVREAIHDDEYNQFAGLEARAFATLLELAAEQDALAR